jgi:hypothetical protein
MELSLTTLEQERLHVMTQKEGVFFASMPVKAPNAEQSDAVVLDQYSAGMKPQSVVEIQRAIDGCDRFDAQSGKFYVDCSKPPNCVIAFLNTAVPGLWYKCTIDAKATARIRVLLVEFLKKVPAAAKSATGTKIGRNEPCPCGSGKKYKQCCLT